MRGRVAVPAASATIISNMRRFCPAPRESTVARPVLIVANNRYTRIQGTMKNLGHRVARSTIASILKAESIPPSCERPTARHVFLRAHWPALVAADFFTTEVWTVRGLVTVLHRIYDRAAVAASAPGRLNASSGRSVVQAMRDLTDGFDGVLGRGRVLICDCDRKWSRGVLEFLDQAHVRILQTPLCPPNCKRASLRTTDGTREAQFIAYRRRPRSHGSSVVRGADVRDTLHAPTEPAVVFCIAPGAVCQTALVPAPRPSCPHGHFALSCASCRHADGRPASSLRS